jgi:hypothetical protein
MPDLLLKRAAASPGEVYDVICEERAKEELATEQVTPRGA